MHLVSCPDSSLKIAFADVKSWPHINLQCARMDPRLSMCAQTADPCCVNFGGSSDWVWAFSRPQTRLPNAFTLPGTNHFWLRVPQNGAPASPFLPNPGSARAEPLHRLVRETWSLQGRGEAAEGGGSPNFENLRTPPKFAPGAHIFFLFACSTFRS